MYRILITEDDYTLALALKKQIESYGNEVFTVDNFQQVTQAFLDVKPQLVLMDIMLPYKDGYFWCNEIRKHSNVPIVFLSSASDNMNIVMAVNMGGDDFIAKPVDPMVLNAKITAILRRTYEIGGEYNLISFHGAFFNTADGTVTYNGKSLELTKNEHRILQALLENKGRIVSRDTLMMRLWQSDIYVEENTLSVNVGRLRKKLEEYGLIEVIITKPGNGYIIQ